MTRPYDPIFTLRRLCVICRKYQHAQETIWFKKPRGMRNAFPWYICVSCFEKQRSKVEDLIGVERVEEFIKNEQRQGGQDASRKSS